MYYQNGNYMQDLNYYNQNPNMGYHPYAQNMNGPMPMGQIGQQNLNAMYPAVYRIISPVASQVLSNSNNGYLTEDSLNNMVDTVYNVVERDISSTNTNSAMMNTTQANTNTNSNENNCGRASSNSSSSSNNTATTTSTQNTQNSLLRDLIKIMLLNEILARRQNQTNQMMMQNANMNQNMFL